MRVAHRLSRPRGATVTYARVFFFFFFFFPFVLPTAEICRTFSHALSTISSDDVSYNPASCHVRGESALVLSRVISRATACFVRAESDTPLTITLLNFPTPFTTISFFF